jgi:hypothetical protein
MTVVLTHLVLAGFTSSTSLLQEIRLLRFGADT